MHYLGALGAGGILAGTIIEAMGIPFPGGVMVIIAGFLVDQDRLNFYHVLLAAVGGFDLGALIAYLIGRRVGEPFFQRYGNYLHITPQKFERAQSWLTRSAAAFIIVGRFVPMISNLTPYMAGVSKLSPARFLFYNSIFAVIWASFNLAVGIVFGQNWERISRLTRSWLPLGAAVLLLLYLVYLYLRHQKKTAGKI
ncbi:hypothetical protein A6M21_05930 [Desulfotomaculum copahuensis]|uniref:VTT domain-containing protein n=2 Tax=Desulfotomaculum copahuensis TaxID=1838280 RepID=A0A1B7LH77_9FIRM|nr:hypothetical protein A6M21_05930 [Desulfotomaculum copahuensis]